MNDIDLSVFSSDDFDSIKWLNEVFGNEQANAEQEGDKSVTGKDVEALGTNLVFKLQMILEETNNSLQEIAQRMSLSVPKVIGETEVLSKEVTDLCNHVVDVRTKLICTEQQSSEAVESLIKLDVAKHRLHETYKSLQEANNWTTLTIDVDEVFENGQIDQISVKLLSMQKSLEMLSLSSTGNENLREKLELVESLKNRFEKLVEPLLFDAFTNQTTELIESYSKLFRDLHRSDRLIVFYQTCLRDQLLREWSKQIQLDSNETLLDWLNFLYDRLITIWKTQMNFCMKVLYSDDYEGSLTVLCDIYTDIILSLDPTIENCFERCIQEESDSNRNDKTWKQKSLIELKHLTNQFMKSIEQNIFASSSMSNGSVNVLTTQFAKRVPSLDSFIRTIYRPFVMLHQRFLQFERDRLGSELLTITSSCTSIVVCSEYIMKLFSLARESFKLYINYVESYPILIVEEVLQDFLLRFLTHIRTNLNQTLSAASIHQTPSKSTGQLTNVSPIPSITTPNWSLVQQTLFAFQIVGEFLLQLENFQQQVALSLEESRAKIESEQTTSESKGSLNSYLTRFDNFILNLDSNDQLCVRIKNYLESSKYQLNIEKNSSVSRTVFGKVLIETIKLAKISAQAICDSIMEYIHLYLTNLFASIQQQIQEEIADYSKDRSDSHDVDSLSFSPHEFITQIGQYLLTLPQHLEPFNPNENAAFKLALKHSIDVFTGDSLKSITFDTTELLLDSIVRQTTRSFLDHILRVPSYINSATSSELGRKRYKLNANIRKQIGVDLSYLAAVCEDLGLTNDKEYLLCVQVFNEIHSQEAFKLIAAKNANYSRLLSALEEFI